MAAKKCYRREMDAELCTLIRLLGEINIIRMVSESLNRSRNGNYGVC